EMINDADTRFLTFTGNLIATGLRGIIAQLIRSRIFNVIITTCGAVDHDIARAFGGKYYKGYFYVDDEELKKRNIHRLGNIFIPLESYGPLIEKVTYRIMDEILASTSRNEWAVHELLKEFGKRIEDANSILKAAFSANVPVFVPGIVDGAFGTALFTYSQLKKFRLNLLDDMKKLSDIVFRARKLGALIIGGGISKHHAIWWAQFKEGLDFVIYITTAVEWDGSLSGAHPREAITWGKVKPKAKRSIIYGDASVILPIIASQVLHR
ncbi:MAG: deoxyhypusine synthase, partial [Thermoprotei archaeon]